MIADDGRPCQVGGDARCWIQGSDWQADSQDIYYTTITELAVYPPFEPTDSRELAGSLQTGTQRAEDSLPIGCLFLS